MESSTKFTYREFCLMMKRYEKEKTKKESKIRSISSPLNTNKKTRKGK